MAVKKTKIRQKLEPRSKKNRESNRIASHMSYVRKGQRKVYGLHKKPSDEIFCYPLTHIALKQCYLLSVLSASFMKPMKPMAHI